MAGADRTRRVCAGILAALAGSTVRADQRTLTQPADTVGARIRTRIPYKEEPAMTELPGGTGRHSGQGDTTGAGLVHLVSGWLPSGWRVRAVCSCGHTTNPRADDALALAALRAAHELTSPVCALCGHDYTGGSWQQLRDGDLRALTDATGKQFLACRDLSQSCHDGYDQRQMHLDRAAFEGFSLPVPTPHLRVLPGDGQ